MARDIDWSILERACPQAVEGSIYSQMQAVVGSNSILLVKADMPDLNSFWPRVRVVGWVIETTEQHKEMLAHIGQANGRIQGYYTLSKSSLLNLFLEQP